MLIDTGYCRDGDLNDLTKNIYPDNSVNQNGGVFIDTRNNEDYKWVEIGNQIWMAENLNFHCPGSSCYNNEDSICDIYGRLYNWHLATTVCPDGWHLPSQEEWTNLELKLGWGSYNDIFKEKGGGKLKSISSDLWENPNKYATNETGFSALPGGMRSENMFSGLGYSAYFWTSSSDNREFSTSKYLSYDAGYILKQKQRKNRGMSVRCVKD